MLIDKYGTHQEILKKYVQLYPENVIELGAGYYSTPIINQYAKFSQTIDNDDAWLANVSKFRSEKHSIIKIDSWAEFCPQGRYSLAFVDHADTPDHQRWIQVLKLIPYSDIIIVHDYEDPLYGYSNILNMVEVLEVHELAGVKTAVLRPKNKIDLSKQNSIIAISTYNNNAESKSDLLRVINSCKNTCNLPIYVFDDGSDPEYQEFLQKLTGVNYLFLGHGNRGIANIKNQALSLFKSDISIDIIYLMDDDIELSKGWEEEYKSALRILPLISFYDPLYRHNDHANSGFLYDAENLSCFNCCHGAMVGVTRACWDTIGEYKVFPEKYGGEHQEYYYRAAIAGLVPIEGFYDVKNSSGRLISLYAGDEYIDTKRDMTQVNLRSAEWMTTENTYTSILNGYKSMKKLKIGIDLDGTVYSNPDFFGAMITSMHKDGHEFYCISSHAKSDWDQDQRKLKLLGINPDLISSEMMYDERHGHIHLKAKQADKLDFIFDDDFRVQQLTKTIQFCPLKGGNAKVIGDKVIYE